MAENISKLMGSVVRLSDGARRLGPVKLAGNLRGHIADARIVDHVFGVKADVVLSELRAEICRETETPNAGVRRPHAVQ
eukprot:11016799-Heterocapsa_arctica.AAC.1